MNTAEAFDRLRELIQRVSTGPSASLLERAEEFRKRATRVTIVVVLLFSTAMTFAAEIFRLVRAPLVQALPPGAPLLHFTGPLEVLMCYMHVAFLAGVLVAAPYALWELWRFLGPALGKDYQRGLPPFFIASFALFVAGITFCQVVIMPVTLKFLIGLGDGRVEAMITFDDYVGLVSFMLLGFGAAFELPLVMIALERLGIIRVEMLTKNRGPILVGILVIAALVTPTPDPFSQLAMATPMYLMFEAAILIIKRTRRREAAGARGLPATPSPK